MKLQLVAKTGHPDFLDLPWDRPLEEWESERLVEVVRGIGRHVVRFVDYDGSLYPGGGVAGLSNRLLDSIADLLVRLHLAGFFWGDCSLSNTLFRRDAGALAAYVVDTETSELHPQLTDGQRVH